MRTDDPRIEAGARALCGHHGLNPDEPVLRKGELVAMWRTCIPAARAVIEAADTADTASPAMEQAGVDALRAGSPDAGSLVQKIWLAMTTLRGRGGE